VLARLRRAARSPSAPAAAESPFRTKRETKTENQTINQKTQSVTHVLNHECYLCPDRAAIVTDY